MEPTEITREAFNKLVSSNTLCKRVEEKEHYRKEFYYVEEIDMTLFRMDSFVTGTRQYYILDINY